MADPEASGAPSGAEDASAVPYQSLYRRYRPQRFDEVKGQEHVTRALRNAVRDEKVAHAYLFSGPRGTGKTSTARILAMALNCANPLDGEPDGICDSCVEIRRGSSLDVYELDAASNRKLDEMRDLLSRVALGTRGRWKVYIVDEVHQLTSDAASALLKTLEEPPAHVVFVLATTDPQKVLPTIRSRTQHFEFRLLSADVLGQLLHDVNGKAGLGVAPEAIDLVVRRGHGSARDALSVLDQVAAAGEVESEAEVVAEITDGLADADAGRVILAVAEGISAGRDPRRLAADLLDHLRNGFLALQARQLVLLPDDAAAEVEVQARRLGLPGVVRAMEVIGQALVDMRDSVDSRITLEVALVRLSNPRADTSVAALAERIDQLERQLRDLSHPAGTGNVSGEAMSPSRQSTSPLEGSSRSLDDGETNSPGAAGEGGPPAAAPLRLIVGDQPEDGGSGTGGSGNGGQPNPSRTFPRPAPRPDAGVRQGAPPTVSPGPGSGAGTDDAAPSSPPPRPPGPRSALGAHRKTSSPTPPKGPGAPAPTPQGSSETAPGPGGAAPSRPAPAAPPSRSAAASQSPPSRPAPVASPSQSAPVASPSQSAPVASPSQSAPSRPAPPTLSPPRVAEAPPATRPHPPASTPAPPSVAQPSVAQPSVAQPSVAQPSVAPAAAPVPPDADASGAAPRPMPSRDDLTEAWADAVLPKLRVPARAFLVSGRFLSVEEGVAVFAVPDRPLLDRAASVKGEAEAALSDHFGRRIMLRLVHDRQAAPPPPAPSDEPAPEDPADYDLDDLDDAPSAVVSPEARLLRAFPGAKEVGP